MSECPYIVGNECDIDRCNAFFDKAKLLDKVMQKWRTIIDDDGVMYKVVFLKDIEDMKAEIEEVRVNEHSKEDK